MPIQPSAMTPVLGRRNAMVGLPRGRAQSGFDCPREGDGGVELSAVGRGSRGRARPSGRSNRSLHELESGVAPAVLLSDAFGDGDVAVRRDLGPRVGGGDVRIRRRERATATGDGKKLDTLVRIDGSGPSRLVRPRGLTHEREPLRRCEGRIDERWSSAEVDGASERAGERGGGRPAVAAACTRES